MPTSETSATPAAAPEPIRWGIVSTGHIAGVFTSDLGLLPDHTVVAVGSRDLTRAQEFARRHGIPRAYDSYAALAEDPEVQVVYIATPHSDHAATARLCLEAGKAVLCEKPFTVNAKEASELASLARSRGVFCMEAMWMWCNPIHRRLYAALAAGEIGAVRTVTADLGFRARYDPTDRLFAPELAGGALLDVGIYPLSFAYRILGPPDGLTVHAELAPTGVDSMTAMQLEYAGGAVAHLVGSFDATLSSRATISGTDGWIELPADFQVASRYTVHRPNAEPLTYREQLIGSGYVYEAQEVARCLREGRAESTIVPLDDTLAVMELMDRIREQTGVRYPAD